MACEGLAFGGEQDCQFTGEAACLDVACEASECVVTRHFGSSDACPTADACVPNVCASEYGCVADANRKVLDWTFDTVPPQLTFAPPLKAYENGLQSNGDGKRLFLTKERTATLPFPAQAPPFTIALRVLVHSTGPDAALLQVADADDAVVHDITHEAVLAGWYSWSHIVYVASDVPGEAARLYRNGALLGTLPAGQQRGRRCWMAGRKCGTGSDWVSRRDR